MSNGRITQVTGPVGDVEFPPGQIPEIGPKIGPRSGPKRGDSRSPFAR